MTKADLVELVHTTAGFSKKEAADLVELIFDEMKEALAKSGKIKISGFGNFVGAMTPKEGQLVWFPTYTLHGGTPPQKSKKRIIINFILEKE